MAGRSEQAVSRVKSGRRKLFEVPILLFIQARLKMMENAHARAFVVRITVSYSGKVKFGT